MKIMKDRPVQLVDGMDDMDIVEFLLGPSGPLKKHNGPRGRLGLFSRYGQLTRVEEVGGGTRGDARLVGPEPITVGGLKALIESHQAFEYTTRLGPTPKNLSLGVLHNLMELGEWEYDTIPEVVGASEWVTARSDGTLVTDSGYDPQTKVYVRMDNAVWSGVRSCEDAPPPEHVSRAKHLLLTDLLGDFEFETAADLANALGIILTGAVRHAFNGLVPLVLLDATMAQSGKGTLAAVMSQMFGMDAPEVRAFAQDDEELNKQIVSILRSSSKPFITWDNVERPLDGEALAVLLTTPVFTGRVLGASQDFTGLNDRVWAVTGNNLRLGKDIRRRSIRCRQKPTHDPREGKRQFRHPDLFKWMAQHKADLAWAVSTCVRAWAAAGRPDMMNQDPVNRLASYRNWANMVGGILDVIEVPGFLDNVVSLQYDDEATEELKGMVTALEGEFGTHRFTPQEAATFFGNSSAAQEVLPDWIRGKGPFVDIKTRHMKSWLREVRGRMCGIGELRIEDASGEKATHFAVVGAVQEAPATVTGGVAQYSF